MNRKNKNNTSSEKENLEVHFYRNVRKIQMRIFQINTIQDLQSFIQKQLPAMCGVQHIRICKKKMGKKGYVCVPLASYPSHFLSFQKSTPYSLEEKRLLRKVAGSVNISLNRMEKYHQLRLLKSQWKATFNAIKKPICLTDHQFSILSSNDSFLQQTNKCKSDIYRQNCFSIFFHSPLSHSEQKELLQSKILKSLNQKEKIFEVYCQSFAKQETEETLRLIIFTDMTEKIKMENQMNRLAGSAEMGIITSSIAHELNNPLSGMQSLLQIAMDRQNQTHDNTLLELGTFADDMLQAICRCQQIVKQLLNLDSVQDLSRISKLKKDKSLAASFSSS